MNTIHGKKLSKSQINNFLDKHFESIKNKKTGREKITLSLTPNNSKILDFGCGWGYYANALSLKGNIIEAIDYDNEISIAKEYWPENPNITFSTSKIQTFENEYFDCVLSCQVLEHVHNPGTFLSEINRVLKDQGSFVVSVPNIINPRYIFPHFNWKYESKLKAVSKNMLDNYDKTNHHINSWDPRHFVNLLASTGFILDAYRTSEGIPLPQVFPFNKFGNGYITNFISRLGFINNFSYTMHFRFIKSKKVLINKND